MRNLTDSTSATVASYEYDVYGAFTLTGSSHGNTYTFTGRQWDVESGLYYYRARYYAPAVGRFLQIDPIKYKEILNLYTYVINDPINIIDPSGKKMCVDKEAFESCNSGCVQDLIDCMDAATTIYDDCTAAVDQLIASCKKACTNPWAKPLCDLACEEGLGQLKWGCRAAWVTMVFGCVEKNDACYLGCWAGARYEVPDTCPCRDK